MVFDELRGLGGGEGGFLGEGGGEGERGVGKGVCVVI